MHLNGFKAKHKDQKVDSGLIPGNPHLFPQIVGLLLPLSFKLKVHAYLASQVGKHDLACMHMHIHEGALLKENSS